MTQTLSAKGVQFIATFEGWVPTCYDDAGRNCTIGFGHLIHRGPTTATDRKDWGAITKPRGYTLLHTDAQTAIAAVKRYIKVPLTQAQFDALVSFAYNCGGGALTGDVGAAVNSKPKLAWPGNILALRKWHGRVKSALLQWDHVNGQVLPGLYRRRLDEANLFTSGKYVV